ncbi:MAG: cytoplasmic protein [Phycisphaerae bacterium]|nr:cytoplasmic protein [Phycisphaerae bacterium]
MPELISEPITPLAGPKDAAAMARGEPGLPLGFTWRGREYRIADVLERWKQTGREGSRADGEVYVRRHAYRLRMNDGAEWSVYFVRQTPRSGSARRRWFLYSIEPASNGPGV